MTCLRAGKPQPGPDPAYVPTQCRNMDGKIPRSELGLSSTSDTHWLADFSSTSHSGARNKPSQIPCPVHCRFDLLGPIPTPKPALGKLDHSFVSPLNDGSLSTLDLMGEWSRLLAGAQSVFWIAINRSLFLPRHRLPICKDPLLIAHPCRDLRNQDNVKIAWSSCDMSQTKEGSNRWHL